ncbi:hypothetical protein RIF29_15422 [Crotalaria pallida]|uniref:F-box domain-containing protein n=1 Tax=Crotalaria pallida TaxID=3830 RepID=A0AAN9FDH6_CROPI
MVKLEKHSGNVGGHSMSDVIYIGSNRTIGVFNFPFLPLCNTNPTTNPFLLCGRCGQPKKGHTSSTVTPADPSLTVVSVISTPTPLLVTRQAPSHLRRTLSFDDFDDHTGAMDVVTAEPDLLRNDRVDKDSFEEPSDPLDLDLDSCSLRAGLLLAAKVCKGWRDTARRLWRAAEELKLRVPASVHVGFVASLLQKCPGMLLRE